MVLDIDRSAGAHKDGGQIQLRGVGTVSKDWVKVGNVRAQGAARAHHVVEILPLQGERRHEGLGPRERGTIDRKVQRLDAVLDEGDDLARLELRTRNDLRKATSLEGFQLLSLAPILRWTWFEADPQPCLQGAARQKESAHEKRRRGLRRTPVRGRG